MGGIDLVKGKILTQVRKFSAGKTMSENLPVFILEEFSPDNAPNHSHLAVEK